MHSRITLSTLCLANLAFFAWFKATAFSNSVPDIVTVTLDQPLKGVEDAEIKFKMLDGLADREQASNIKLNCESITAGYREQHDVAVEFIRSRNPDHRIGIIGRSLGGATALMASPLEIQPLILESAYPTIGEAVHKFPVSMYQFEFDLASNPLIYHLFALTSSPPNLLLIVPHIS